MFYNYSSTNSELIEFTGFGKKNYPLRQSLIEFIGIGEKYSSCEITPLKAFQF
jgi:hypothetical protein